MRSRLINLFLLAAVVGGSSIGQRALASVPPPAAASRLAPVLASAALTPPFNGATGVRLLDVGYEMRAKMEKPAEDAGGWGVGEDRYGRCTIWDPAHPTALGYHPFGRGKGC